MYTEIRSYQLTDAWQGRVKDVVSEVERGLVPTLADAPGFVGFYLIDGGDGLLSTVVVCEDRASIDEMNRRAAEWGEQRFASAVQGHPQVVAGETVVSRERR